MEDARTRTTAPAVVREAVITAFMGAIPRHAGPPEDHKDTGDTPGGKVWQGTPPPSTPKIPCWGNFTTGGATHHVPRV